jgi:hypothetical protein
MSAAAVEIGTGQKELGAARVKKPLLAVPMPT